jgi:TusA-related sulfurtransferase
MSDARIVDALGTHCPVPVRLLARAIARAPVGTKVRLLADDPLVAIDVPAWCHTHGHEIVQFTESGGTWTAIVVPMHAADRSRSDDTDASQMLI